MRTIKVNGMSCQHCAKAVTKALSEIDGVKDVTVDVSKGVATFDEDKPVDTEILKERIKRAGYELG